MTEEKKTALVPPTRAGEWSITQITEALSRPLPRSLIKTKTVKGTSIRFIEWHTAAKIMNKYAPGWSFSFTYDTHQFDWEKNVKQRDGSYELKTGVSRELFVIGTLTIPTAEGPVSQQASGLEDTDNPSIYGSSIQNAEANAFKRCCAKFGLGLHLYEK